MGSVSPPLSSQRQAVSVSTAGLPAPSSVPRQGGKPPGSPARSCQAGGLRGTSAGVQPCSSGLGAEKGWSPPTCEDREGLAGHGRPARPSSAGGRSQAGPQPPWDEELRGLGTRGAELSPDPHPVGTETHLCGGIALQQPHEPLEELDVAVTDAWGDTAGAQPCDRPCPRAGGDRAAPLHPLQPCQPVPVPLPSLCPHSPSSVPVPPRKLGPPSQPSPCPPAAVTNAAGARGQQGPGGSGSGGSGGQRSPAASPGGKQVVLLLQAADVAPELPVL